MITINLLPGSGKKVRGRASVAGLGAALAEVAARVKDPYLIGGVACVAIASAAVGTLHVGQSRRAEELAERERAAVQDSSRYAAVLGERVKAQAQLDTVTRQIAIIRAIDDNRYVWPHVMDEVSRALPPYTWLTTIAQTSAPPPPPGAIDTAAGRDSTMTAADSAAARAIKFQIGGNTVDIQALTRFMRVLEASPFVENVSLAKSGVIIVDGQEVTDFQLDAEYQRPDSAAIHTRPVTLSVR
jgi:Tfp pilus assembly protein PilN